MNRIRILLIHQDLFWKRIVEFSLTKESDFVVVGSVKTKEDAIKAMSLVMVDVVVMECVCQDSKAVYLEDA